MSIEYTVDANKVTLNDAVEMFSAASSDNFTAMLPLIEAVSGITPEQMNTLPLPDALRISKDVQNQMTEQFQSGVCEGADVVIDLEKWTMPDFMEFNNALRTAKFEEASASLAKVITEWTFAGRPGTVSNYGKLTLVQFGFLIAEVNKAIQGIFR